MPEGRDWAWLAGMLACPACKGAVTLEPKPPLAAGEIRCQACGDTFTKSPGAGVLDLRLQRPIVRDMQLPIGRTNYARRWQDLEKTPPPVTLRQPAPERTSPGFLSIIQDTLPAGAILVDLGCGGAPYRAPLKRLGLRHVATDFDNPAADLLVDAHALPFRDATADAVLMHSVTQALENPFIAIAEVARVLRPGGLFFGTADPGAVFASSFFHMTPYGVISVLASQDLEPLRAWVEKDILQYAGTNPGYPAVLKPLLRGLAQAGRWQFLSPRNWLAGRHQDPFVTAGCFSFVARRVQA